MPPDQKSKQSLGANLHLSTNMLVPSILQVKCMASLAGPLWLIRNKHKLTALPAQRVGESINSPNRIYKQTAESPPPPPASKEVN
jgi:hypothetical protein